MQKSCGSKTLVHALALVGLGGTGKTQLARHYIAQHKSRYDTVLWLDVRNDATTMSSFERCCDALSIRFESRLSRGSPHDAPAVQRLMQWLAARKQDQKWLVVLDNADDLDQLELTQIIPENAVAGSVIITSQDGKAAKLVHRAKCTRVDRMETEEGKALLAQCMEVDQSQVHWGVMSRLEKLVNHLDGIALALDLAGARIRDDMETTIDLHFESTDDTAVAAIDQYFLDLGVHKRTMLSSLEHSAASSYKKTIWSVWGTVLSSLESSEERDAQASAYPLQLLKLAVALGPTIVHREIFRAASQSFGLVCTTLGINVPLWLESLLQVSATGTWDCFAYKASLARLLRFNLVHLASQDVQAPLYHAVGEWPLFVSWPGFTMHSLVRWRIGTQTAQAEYETYRTILMTACYRSCNEYEDGIDFRCALRGYMEHEKRELRLDALTPQGLSDVRTMLGLSLVHLNGPEFALSFLVKALNQQVEVSGEKDDTLSNMEHGLAEVSKLLVMCILKSNEPAVIKILSDFVHESQEPLRENPELEVRTAAALWTADMMHLRLKKWMIDLAGDAVRERSIDAKTFFSDAFQKKYDELAEIISEQIRMLEMGKRLLGWHHDTVSTLRSNLAHIYSSFNKFELERSQLEELLASRQYRRGKHDPLTMQSMERLARCLMKLGDPDGANEMMTDLCRISGPVFGNDDPRTLLRTESLGRLSNLKSRNSHAIDEMEFNLKISDIRKEVQAEKNLGPTAKRIMDVFRGNTCDLKWSTTARRRDMCPC